MASSAPLLASGGIGEVYTERIALTTEDIRSNTFGETIQTFTPCIELDAGRTLDASLDAACLVLLVCTHVLADRSCHRDGVYTLCQDACSDVLSVPFKGAAVALHTLVAAYGHIVLVLAHTVAQLAIVVLHLGHRAVT